jgi:RecA-family ATPase
MTAQVHTMPSLENAIDPTAEERAARPKFEFFEGDELTSKPTPIKFLIDGFIEENITGLVYGPSENGKSLVLLDWAFCITNGIEWEGRQTKQTEVLIIAGEGHAGYRRRLKALELKYGMKASKHLMISKAAVRIDDPASCDDINQAMKAHSKNPGLIIIDTFHRNMDGDENSSKDVGRVLNNIDQFFRSQGAAVLVVHHTGHGQDRARGSSSIRGGVDAEYSVFKDDNTSTVTLTCTKGKDLEKPKPMGFVLKPVQIDWTISDEDLRPQTSVYLEYTGEVEKTAKKRKLSPRNTNILQSLTDALNEKGIEPTTEMRLKFGGFNTGTFAKIVSINEWREYAYKAISAETNSANKKAFERFRNDYLNSYIEESDGYVWRIDPNDKRQEATSDSDKLATSDKNDDNDSDRRQKRPTEALSGLSDNLSHAEGSDNKRQNDNANNDKALSISDNKRQQATNSKVSHDDDATTATHFYRSVAVVASQSTPEILDDEMEEF